MNKKCGSFLEVYEGGESQRRCPPPKKKNTAVRTLYVQCGRTEQTYALEYTKMLLVHNIIILYRKCFSDRIFYSSDHIHKTRSCAHNAFSETKY